MMYDRSMAHTIDIYNIIDHIYIHLYLHSTMVHTLAGAAGAWFTRTYRGVHAAVIH